MSLSPLLILILFLSGCGDRDKLPPTTEAQATPIPATPQDLTDATSERLKRKTDKVVKSLHGFLQGEDPRLQAKLQKLAGKITRDQDGWRKKFQRRREELQPRIDQLKKQVAEAEGKPKAELDGQLAALEEESQRAEKKLSALKGASGGTRDELKSQFKEDDAKADMATHDADPTP